MIKPSQPLPQTYERALSLCLVIVQKLLVEVSEHVNELTYASELWRSRWKIVSKKSTGATVALERNDGRPIDLTEDYQTDRILYCLMVLGQKPEARR